VVSDPTRPATETVFPLSLKSIRLVEDESHVKVESDMRKKHFAEYYDAIASKPGARRRARTILSYVKRYRPSARTILDLGTGNGNGLSSFPRKYELYGLDIEEKYIELTRRKVPRASTFPPTHYVAPHPLSEGVAKFFALLDILMYAISARCFQSSQTLR